MLPSEPATFVKRLPERVPNVHGVWNTFGSRCTNAHCIWNTLSIRCTNVAGSMGIIVPFYLILFQFMLPINLLLLFFYIFIYWLATSGGRVPVVAVCVLHGQLHICCITDSAI